MAATSKATIEARLGRFALRRLASRSIVIPATVDFDVLAEIRALPRLLQVLCRRKGFIHMPAHDIALSVSTVAEDAALGAVVGVLSAVNGHTVTFTLVDDASGKFDISGTNLIVTGVLDFETATSHSITVRAADGGITYDEGFTITVTNVSETPPAENPPPDDGDVIVDDPAVFPVAVAVTVVNGGIKFHGKKTSGSSGKFIYDLGPPVAGHTYTISYDPDFTLLANHGVTAMIGFGLKEGNDFRLSGLKGDGSTGLKAYEISGDNKWNSNTGFTTSDGGAALHGTQAGSNWVQLEVSADGTTYTMRTSANGTDWDDEFTDVVPSPFAAVDDATTFGIAVFLEAADAGSFSILITLWEDASVADADLWTPAQLSPAELLYWYDFGDQSARALSGSAYTQLNDKSGNARHLTPNSGAPTVSAAALNGLDVGAFNGTNQDLAITGLNITNAGRNQTIIGLFKINDANSRIPFFTYDNLSVGNLTYFNRTAGSMNLTVGTNDAAGFVNSDTGWQMFSGSSTVTLRTLWLEGLSKATNSTVVANGPIRWIILGSATTQFLLGNMAEVVGYVGTDVATRQKIEGYMAWRWGRQAALDAGHPYKSAAPTLTALWTPDDLTSTKIGYWDFTDAASLTKFSTTHIGTIIDQWGNSDRSLTQATDGNRPTVNASALNGSDSALFSIAGSQYLANQSMTPIASAGINQTVILVMRVPTYATGGFKLPYFTHNNTNGNQSMILIDPGGIGYAGVAGLLAQVATPTNGLSDLAEFAETDTASFHIISATFTTTFRQIWKDGLSKATSSTTQGTNGTIASLFLGTDTSRFGGMELAVAAAFVGTDQTDRDKFVGWLAWEYPALLALLDTAHPYKNAAPRV